MICFLLSLANIVQAHLKFVSSEAGSPYLPLLYAIPCSAASPSLSQSRLLPDRKKEGQHEKNANQRDSGRGVADGDGRWPAPLRPQHRITRQRT